MILAGINYGSDSFKIEIHLTGKYPEINDDVSLEARTAAEKISTEIRKIEKKNDHKTVIETENNRKLLDIFSEPIYVDEIPNGYCSEWCCEHLPWFIVTTKIGRIKIGWRKRVINIDWSDTDISIKSEELFPDEYVTKYDQYIHADSLEKAKEYIDIIMKQKN